MSCEYCCDLKSQKNLYDKDGTNIYIDANKKKIVFEHTTFRYTTQYDPYSGDENVCIGKLILRIVVNAEGSYK